MASVTVPISEASHKILLELASRAGQPIGKIVDQAIEEYRRQRLLDESNAAYLALRRDKQAWREESAERRDWEATLADGISDE